jgi:TatD DNase family protein
MFTDSHCHLSMPNLVVQLPAIRAAMAEAQVTRALCICTTLEEFADVHALATGFDNFWATVGVHPDNDDVQEPTLLDLVQRSALPRVVAIGETGLDYYRLGERSVADMEWQRMRFRTHIRAARQVAKPTPSPSCAKRARTAPWAARVACSTASPKPRPWPVPRWTWVFIFPSRAS